MGKLVMATIDYDSDNLEILIKDIQRIERVPDKVVTFIKENFKGRRLNKNGLPSVMYLGEDRVVVVGAVIYGEIAFLDVEGKWKNINKEQGLVCITAYREGKTYKELEEGKEEYTKGIKEKYKDGITV